MPAKLQITGQKFGRLTAIRPTVGRKWMFECDCGGAKSTSASHVKMGLIRSCGCLKYEPLTPAEREAQKVEYRQRRNAEFWHLLRWKNHSIAEHATRLNITPAEVMKRLAKDKDL